MFQNERGFGTWLPDGEREKEKNGEVDNWLIQFRTNHNVVVVVVFVLKKQLCQDRLDMSGNCHLTPDFDNFSVLDQKRLARGTLLVTAELLGQGEFLSKNSLV